MSSNAPLLKLSDICVVGGEFPRRFDWSKWKLAPHLQKVLTNLIREYPEDRFYVYLTIEPLDQMTPVPVAVIVKCKCTPTLLVAKTSVQGSLEKVVEMEALNLIWKEVNENDSISFLKSRAPHSYTDKEFMLLYLKRPSAAADELVEPVGAVTVNWNGHEATWYPEHTAEELVDTFDDLQAEIPLTDDDKIEIAASLRTRLEEVMGTNASALRVKKESYNAMVEEIAAGADEDSDSIRARLEEMTVFKVYPEHDSLNPVQTWHGPTGYRKNTAVNRYIGNAEGFF